MYNKKKTRREISICLNGDKYEIFKKVITAAEVNHKTYAYYYFLTF